ncbi:MAG: prepilin-type N-terminal cleavage/methylation domain-containing protein, partial [Polaromonas sp.]|uniref:prepilin-type N-terminal cleavage/methylation domain-containing protein n=1 Tax=Polaromonas sp. TaxID=1869339 RepID=UPI0027301E74
MLAAGTKRAPTLATSCAALPPGGAGLAWGGPALRPIAPTLAAAGASPRSLAARIRHGGFTLLELLIVVA